MRTPFKTLLAAILAVSMVAFAGCGKDGNSSNTNGNDTYIPIPGPNPQPSGSWVDLGLPSGLLWATCNLGAITPEEYGNYYAWGEVIGKNTFNWSTYRYGSAEGSMTKYCPVNGWGRDGYQDNLTTLQPDDDAATAVLGNGARTPTIEDWAELVSNTTEDWVAQNGVYGRKFIAANGNSIFLPAAGRRIDTVSVDDNTGYYWSSSLSWNDYGYYYPPQAWCFEFSSDNRVSSRAFRYYGLSVRAVRATQN